ncbi:MAG: hypothetical protein LQ345_007178 [Seirophora villosa]|nr:MAG: hypothetical protein LQ345_007178 [Seirophora villosa]
MAMDPTQQKALNALESFILLSKSATSPRSAADLVNQATSAPNTYVFAELLRTPNISALKTASPEHAQYHTLLEIFAWGTWADYSSHPHLPPLSDAQSHKLRQLTLLSLSTSPSSLTYPHLLTALSLPTVRALEDLVISTIYSGLLTAKLNTQTQRVDVSSVSPLRDLRPGSIPALQSTLGAWEARCGSVLDHLENQIKEVKQKAMERRKRELRDDAAVENLVQEAKTGGMRLQDERGKFLGGKRGPGEVGGSMIGASGNDEMDLDDGEKAMGMPRGAKRGGSGGGIKGAAKRFMG